MDFINNEMRKILVLSMDVCDKRCVPFTDRDSLTGYEKVCLGKCIDKNLEMQLRNSEKIAKAFAEEKKNVYD